MDINNFICVYTHVRILRVDFCLKTWIVVLVIKIITVL